MKDAALSAIVIAVCSALVLFWNASDDSTSGLAPERAIRVQLVEPSDEPIGPIPYPVGFDLARVALGRRLFHEPGLSGDGTVACDSCHDLQRGGEDGRLRPIGIRGQLGVINTPSVLNSGISFRQYWDGRAATLEEQVRGPIENPAEMDGDWDAIVAFLGSEPDYVRAFAEAYSDGITQENIENAIATFERSLLTPDSPFDRHLRGEPDALSPLARHGYALFKSYGCIGCHQGTAIGGNMFQRLGVVRDYFADRGSVEQADLGRFNVSGREEDRHVFKVPSLRNVATTAPYFHDGSATTLEDAIRVMSRYQLGREIEGAELEALVAFLESLTGRLVEASS